MNSIRELKEQKENIINNEAERLKLKKQISDLKINRDVAIYAHSLDELLTGDEIHSHLAIMNSLKEDQNVQEFLKLRKKLTFLEQEKKNYYKTIQTKLKEDINKVLNLNIYVYYGKDEKGNIITRNITNSELSSPKDNNILILPVNNIESKRKTRHFYNKVSFKFLEELVKYDDFSVENKDLGKVKVLTKERR